MNIVVLSSIVAVCMAVGAMFIRLKAAKKPATLKKIIFQLHILLFLAAWLSSRLLI